MIEGLPMLGGSEEIFGGLARKLAEVFYKMGLIEITGFVRGVCQGGVGGDLFDQGPQANDGRVLFWRGAYQCPESFFKSILAYVQGCGQVFDPDKATVLFDQLNGLADEEIRLVTGKVCHEECFYDADPVPVGHSRRQAFPDLVQLGGREKIFRRNMLTEQFMRRHPGESVHSAFVEKDQQIGRLFCVEKMAGRHSQTCYGHSGEGPSFLSFHHGYVSPVSKGHYHGSIG